MIHSFDEKNIDDSNNNNITYIKTTKGDIKNTTLIFRVDQEEFDMAEVSQLQQVIAEAFPQCDILTTFKGFELVGVLD